MKLRANPFLKTAVMIILFISTAAMLFTGTVVAMYWAQNTENVKSYSYDSSFTELLAKDSCKLNYIMQSYYEQIYAFKEYQNETGNSFIYGLEHSDASDGYKNWYSLWNTDSRETEIYDSISAVLTEQYGKTNFRYIIKETDSNEVLFTNVGSFKRGNTFNQCYIAMEMASFYIDEYGPYYFYPGSDYVEISDSVSYGYDYFYYNEIDVGDIYYNSYYDVYSDIENLDEYIFSDTPFVYGGFEIYTGIDSSLTYSDMYKTYFNGNQNIKDAVSEAFVPSIILFVVSLSVTAACAVYLCIGAGRGWKTDGTKRVFIDRIYSDILIAVAFICGSLVVAAIFSFMGYTGMIGLFEECLSVMSLQPLNTGITILNIIIVIVLIITLYIIIISTLLSIVRRIKQKELLRHSLIAKILNFLKKIFVKLFKMLRNIFKNMRSIWKMLIILAVYLFAGFICLIPGLFCYSAGLTIFLLICLNAAAVTLACVFAVQFDKVKTFLSKYASGDLSQRVETKDLFSDFKKMGADLNKLNDGMNTAIEEQLKSEHMKTELITNVSHDIKTPLTSIINYVDLLKSEDITSDKASEYLDVLDSKSQRLKSLIEDLIDASKITTGNVSVNMERLCINEMVKQGIGEYQRRFEQKGLSAEFNNPDRMYYIYADGRLLWRMVDNVFSNVNKYALNNTRVYVDLTEMKDKICLIVKNVSSQKLNIDPSELMERFVRGDSSRSTEGSGLGLSIAQSLASLQGGSFNIDIDGDLFKVIITFNTIAE